MQSPGCVILLIDESAGMGAVMRELTTAGTTSNKSNAERVATAVNALVKQLGAGPSFDLALVGYQSDAEGQLNVGCRWAGPLAGREFVPTGELAAAPLRVETRVRKVPVAGAFGPPREETVEFPIWYAPTPGNKAPQIAAYSFCRDLLARWSGEAGPEPGMPLVLHISSGASGDGNPQLAVSKLMELTTPGGHPLLLQAHLAASAAVVSSLYPSNFMYLTVGSARDLFRRASLLPPPLVESLKAAHITVNPGARGLIYNAKLSDLIHCLGLIKAHTRDWPSKRGAAPASPAAAPASSPSAMTQPVAAAMPAEPPAASGVSSTGSAVAGDRAQTALVVLVLDRSVADPYSGSLQTPLPRLQDHANDLLKQLSKFSDAPIDVAIVSYGLDSGGEVEVRSAFEGPLAGQTIVPASELAAGAMRVEEFEEQVSNGIGGLITVNRKKPIYFDVEPTAGAPPVTAFEEIARLCGEWSGKHPGACLPPIVMHLTRGRLEPGDVDWAAGALARAATTAGPPTLYHLIVSEQPHKSLAYPDADDEITDANLKKLWSVTTLLQGREQLASTKRSLTAASRGLVINGKFDLLITSLKCELGGSRG
jgi:hypothetical protein